MKDIQDLEKTIEQQERIHKRLEMVMQEREKLFAKIYKFPSQDCEDTKPHEA